MPLSPDSQLRFSCLEYLITKISGEKKYDIVVVIPWGTSKGFLDKHLEELHKQSVKNFDIILIGSDFSPSSKGINILVYKENYPIGSSGGFGIGQVLAYSLGYDVVIIADVDCFPVSDSIVDILAKKAKETGKGILPFSVFDRSYDLTKVQKNHYTNQYGAFPRHVFVKAGFEYFRFFKGGEDAEYFERLKQEGLLLFEDDAIVEHKNAESNFIEKMNFLGSKYLYYEKNWVIFHIMLAEYCFRKLKVLNGLHYLFSLAKSLFVFRLIYSGYPEFLKACIDDGLSLRIEVGYPPRREGMKVFPGMASLKGRNLVIGESDDLFTFRPRAWLVSNSKPKVVFYLLLKLLRLKLSKGDYVSPSEEFFDNYKFFIQYLLMAKPIKYTDGNIYCYNLGAFGVAGNILFSFILTPLFFVRTLIGLFTIENVADCPILPDNTDASLCRYYEFLKKQNDLNRSLLQK